MIAYLVIAMLALAVFHFIVESILAPSAHMINRLELHRNAMELDRLLVDDENPQHQQAYLMLRTAIHNFIAGMPHFSLVAVTNTIARLVANADPEILERRRKREEVLKRGSDSARDMYARVGTIANQTLSWNTIGWSAYLVPLVFSVAMWRKTEQAVRALLAMPVKQLEESDHEFSFGRRSQFGH